MKELQIQIGSKGAQVHISYDYTPGEPETHSPSQIDIESIRYSEESTSAIDITDLFVGLDELADNKLTAYVIDTINTVEMMEE